MQFDLTLSNRLPSVSEGQCYTLGYQRPLSTFRLLNPSSPGPHLPIYLILPSGSPLHLSVLSWLTASIPPTLSIALILPFSFSSSPHHLRFCLPLSLLCCPLNPIDFSLGVSTAHLFYPSLLLSLFSTWSHSSNLCLILIHSLFSTQHDNCLFIHPRLTVLFLTSASSTHVPQPAFSLSSVPPSGPLPDFLLSFCLPLSLLRRERPAWQKVSSN